MIILDSAHNPEAVMALADTLSTEFDVVGSRMAVVGLLVGRDPRLIAEALVQARLDSVILTSPPSPRRRPGRGGRRLHRRRIVRGVGGRPRNRPRPGDAPHRGGGPPGRRRFDDTPAIGAM
nr:hypothetical protein [Candidatus Microthrix sp.]